jgi:hypothetical protein
VSARFAVRSASDAGSSGINWLEYVCHFVFGFHLDRVMGTAATKRSKRRLVEKCLLVCLLRWLAPRRVLSLPLRCVRFMRLARGTPTRPPKVRAARSPLLPRALRCSLR